MKQKHRAIWKENQPKWPFQQLCSQNFFVNLQGDMLFRLTIKAGGVMTHCTDRVYWKTLSGKEALTIMGPHRPCCWLAQNYNGVSASQASGRRRCRCLLLCLVTVRADRILHYLLDQWSWSPAVTSAAVLWCDCCSVNIELFHLKELLVVYYPCLQEDRRCQPGKCIHRHWGSAGISDSGQGML